MNKKCPKCEEGDMIQAVGGNVIEPYLIYECDHCEYTEDEKGEEIEYS